MVVSIASAFHTSISSFDGDKDQLLILVLINNDNHQIIHQINIKKIYVLCIYVSTYLSVYLTTHLSL